MKSRSSSSNELGRVVSTVRPSHVDTEAAERCVHCDYQAQTGLTQWCVPRLLLLGKTGSD